MFSTFSTFLRKVPIANVFFRQKLMQNTVSFYCSATPNADLDLDYLCSPSKYEEIRQNVLQRKGVGDIDLVLQLFEKQKNSSKSSDFSEIETAKLDFLKAALEIPNKTHPKVISYGTEARIVEMVGSKPEYNFVRKECEKLAGNLDGIRTRDLGNFAGRRSYYLKNSICKLEMALISFFVDKLVGKGFKIVSVPDLLHPNLVQACGMQTKGERSQVYKLDAQRHGVDVCLSGTAEMALASYFKNKTINSSDLPKRLIAVSRCYRAEVSSLHHERGLFRLHEFTKVEMFGLTESSETASESESLLHEFVSIQRELFQSLDLHFRILDMPPHELGAPAYRKYDMEAWMPARKIFGEISSASNCTDYQSRRLLIKQRNVNGDDTFVHTVNGTACAVPRMLIAIFETFQERDGSVRVPQVLRGYLDGLHVLKPVKTKRHKFIR